MAVPGFPLDPRAQGCNMLIRDGATLVQSAEDVLEAIRPLHARPFRETGDDYGRAPAATDLNEHGREALASRLSRTPVPVDELIRQSGLSAAAVQMVLLELELAGCLERHAGGRVSIVD